VERHDGDQTIAVLQLTLATRWLAIANPTGPTDHPLAREPSGFGIYCRDLGLIQVKARQIAAKACSKDHTSSVRGYIRTQVAPTPDATVACGQSHSEASLGCLLSRAHRTRLICEVPPSSEPVIRVFIGQNGPPSRTRRVDGRKGDSRPSDPNNGGIDPVLVTLSNVTRLDRGPFRNKQ